MNAFNKIKEKLSLLTQDPICDIEETKSHTLLSFDLPNMKPEDFELSASGKTLLVRVKRHHICSTDSESTKILQCHHHHFSREFDFPTLINPKNVDAYYQNGVLRIGVPKNTLMTKHTIPIKSSPCGIFSHGKSSETIEPIETFSDIDDYDWE